MAAKESTNDDPFLKLTWDDLAEWVDGGVLDRGRKYQQSHRVTDLARTADGRIIAWVLGSSRYATAVWYDDNILRGDCTCPYWTTCKHAVALILEYLERLKSNSPVAAAKTDDSRLLLLDADDEDSEDDEDFDEDEDDEAEDEEMVAARPARRASSSQKPSPAASLWDYLKEQPKERLLELLKEAASLSSAVHDFLESQYQVSTGRIGQMVTAARRELAALETDFGRRGGRYDDYGSPDVGAFKARLMTLLQAGCFDELLKIGEGFLEKSDDLIESYDQEGEFAGEMEDCLTVVYEGLARSNLPVVEQMKWLVRLGSVSGYDITDAGESAFWLAERGKKEWGELGTALLEILNDPDESVPGGSGRDQLVDHAIRALEEAGREKEVIPLCEQEAERNGSYERLIDRLITAHRWKDAEKWCRQGIEAQPKQPRWGSPTLRDRLRKIYEETHQKDLVAAIRAEEFFEAPGADTFEVLAEAADKTGDWPAVEAWARHYLEIGERPQPPDGKKAAAAKKSSKDLPAWPLPDPKLPRVKTDVAVEAPILRPLIDIAIREKKPDEVLKWYKHLQPSRAHSVPHAAVAAAIGEKYPDQAIGIWKMLAESELTQTGDRAYEAAASHLRPLRDLFIRHKREPEWQKYLDSIRNEHRRKRNLMAILDRLESGNRPIVKT